MIAAILEGPPHEKMEGWRHYLIAFRDADIIWRTCISRPADAWASAQFSKAKTYPFGTWENPVTIAEGVMPCPLPEVVAEISGTQQMEFAP